MEEFRKIPIAENYEINIYGDIRSIDRITKGKNGCFKLQKGKKISKQPRHVGRSNKTYFYSSIYVNGKMLCKGVHYFVAISFPEICGEWFEGAEVHHLDKNPRNNCAYNLKVVSKEEHIELHKYDLTKGNGVYKYDLNWNFIERYDNSEYAAASVCGSKESLSRVLSNKDNKKCYYKGFFWLYE